jgi:hypothetical protein
VSLAVAIRSSLVPVFSLKTLPFLSGCGPMMVKRQWGFFLLPGRVLHLKSASDAVPHWLGL